MRTLGLPACEGESLGQLHAEGGMGDHQDQGMSACKLAEPGDRGVEAARVGGGWKLSTYALQ